VSFPIQNYFGQAAENRTTNHQWHPQFSRVKLYKNQITVLVILHTLHYRMIKKKRVWRSFDHKIIASTVIKNETHDWMVQVKS
jgi:hypothetical protein